MANNVETILKLLEEDAIDAKEAKMLINAVKKIDNSKEVSNKEMDQILKDNSLFSKFKRGLFWLLDFFKGILVVILVYLIKGIEILFKYTIKFLKWILEKLDSDTEKILKDAKEDLSKLSEKTSVVVEKAKVGINKTAEKTITIASETKEKVTEFVEEKINTQKEENFLLEEKVDTMENNAENLKPENEDVAQNLSKPEEIEEKDEILEIDEENEEYDFDIRR